MACRSFTQKHPLDVFVLPKAGSFKIFDIVKEGSSAPKFLLKLILSFYNFTLRMTFWDLQTSSYTCECMWLRKSQVKISSGKRLAFIPAQFGIWAWCWWHWVYSSSSGWMCCSPRTSVYVASFRTCTSFKVSDVTPKDRDISICILMRMDVFHQFYWSVFPLGDTF